jgi:hypothetical protein
MFALVHSKFVAFYLELALEQRLPLLLMRSDEAWQNLGIKLDRIEMLRAQLPVLEEQGLPLFDHLVMMPLDYHENRVEVAKELLSTLKDGLNIFLCHPALDTPELKTIVPHQWRARFGDFQIMMSEEIKKYIKEEGIQVIGYRHLKELMQRS